MHVGRLKNQDIIERFTHLQQRLRPRQVGVPRGGKGEPGVAAVVVDTDKGHPRKRVRVRLVRIGVIDDTIDTGSKEPVSVRF